MSSQVMISDIATDTLKGLSASQKYLLSKYLYDEHGSELFRQIMQMPEYYLTNCEQEIFERQKEAITDTIGDKINAFNLIELGSGDGSKTSIILKRMLFRGIQFKYMPVDISEKAMTQMVETLHNDLPALDIYPITGDYFRMMYHSEDIQQQRKVVFFLGANIGNFNADECTRFFTRLRAFTQTGDLVLIGFDLKKSPQLIMDAYYDPHGITTAFTRNHLSRLNRELDADFNIGRFVHHTTYNPLSGEVKSYLISAEEQIVNIAALEQQFRFRKWEPIFMELSRKYNTTEIHDLAGRYGFKVLKHFTDTNQYFIDSLWIKT